MPMFKWLLRLLLGGIEGWQALEIIGVGHHWLALMFELLVQLDGIESLTSCDISCPKCL